LSASQKYSSTTVSPWCVRSWGTFFATGAAELVTTVEITR
jgi:hypothetical protein